MAFQLWQIEVWASAFAEQFFGVVKKEKAKIEQRTGYRLAAHEKVFFVEVPAARAHDQGGQLRAQFVALPFRTLILNRAANRIAQVVLTLDVVAPSRRVGVLEVGHEHTGARVERIDDHFAVDRPGDFDAPVDQVFRDGRDLPVAFADRSGLGQEVGKPACVNLPLNFFAQCEQLLPPRLKPGSQLQQKPARFRG